MHGNFFISLLLAVGFLSAQISARKYFYQDVCSDSRCSQDCQESQLPQDECLLTTNGGSAVCFCEDSGFKQDVYVFTTNCTMYYYSQTVDLNVCLNGESGYVEYACPSSSRRHKHIREVGPSDVMRSPSRYPTITPLEGIALFSGLRVPLVRHFSSVLGLNHLRHHRVSVIISADVMRIHIRGEAVKNSIRAGLLSHKSSHGDISAYLLRDERLVSPIDAKPLLSELRVSVVPTTGDMVMEIPLLQWNSLRDSIPETDRAGVLRILLVDEVAQEEVITLTL